MKTPIGLRDRLTRLPPYLFFTRYPILMGALLLVVPPVGPELFPNAIANLFQLDPWPIGVVTFFATLSAWSIVFTFRLIWNSVPYRAGLLLGRSRQQDWQEGRYQLEVLKPNLMSHAVAGLSLLLLTPLIGRLVFEARGLRWQSLVAVVGGIVAALGLRELGGRLADIAAPRNVWPAWLFHLSPYARLELPSAQRNQPQLLRSFQVLHWRALMFATVAILLYAIAAPIVRPTGSAVEFVPALAILLATFMVAIWVLGALAFQFDVLRLPPLTLMIVVVMALTFIWPFNYRYPVSEWRAPQLDSRSALNGRVNADGTLIAVAASGGGITASLWTAHVLHRLAEHVDRFHQRVALVSAVSGGAVATVYYIDRFAKDATPSMDRVISDSSDTSLAAAVWGVVYLDLYRACCGFLLGPHDRGWALERRWASHLEDTNRTLGDWVAGIRDGWRPIPLLNATLQETGERWVLSPVRLEPRPASGRRDLFELLPDKDIPVVTAARLSASFPYVSPHPRADVPDGFKQPAYHAADGGYYDASGVVTALDVIDDWVSSDQRPQTLKKVALIEIRAGGEGPTAKPRRDWLGRTITAPFETVLTMRTTSQRARNKREFDLTQVAWRAKSQPVDLQLFTFTLTDDQPLSWHLTNSQHERIVRHWPDSTVLGPDDASVATIARANAGEAQRLKEFLSTK